MEVFEDIGRIRVVWDPQLVHAAQHGPECDGEKCVMSSATVLVPTDLD